MKDEFGKGEEVPAHIEQIERAVEGFFEKLLNETYLTRAGIKEKAEFSSIYQEYGRLFSTDTINEIQSARMPKKRKRFLIAFAVTHYLETQVKEISGEIVSSILASNIKWKDARIPYRSIPGMIANEDDIQTRHTLFDLFMTETERMNPLRIEKLKILNKHARMLGYENCADLFDELRMLRLSYLESMTAPFMERSRDVYLTLLKHQFEKKGIAISEAWTCDTQRIDQLPEFDVHFDKEHLLPHLESTLQDLGVSLSEQSNITIDMEPRPLKSPRPFVVPLKIPDDITIVISPVGGFSSYRYLFHESGHAQHYAHIDTGMPFTYRLLGDGSVEEGFAFLFENLLFNRHWLMKHFDGLDVRPFLAFAGGLRLSFLRTFATKVQYEKLLLSCNDMPEAKGFYSDLFTRNIGVRYDCRDYLAGVDSAFKCGIYLRGWIFEGHLSEYLEKKFGEDWFARSDAGEFLKGLWKKGMRFTAEEIVRGLGYDDLNIEILENKIYRMLD